MSNFLTRPNSTQKLANYLKTFLNEQFEKEIIASNGTISADTIIVRTVANYDKIGCSLADLPLLKVYKNRDIFKKGTLFRTSQGTITYTVSYPQLDVLPNLLDWISYQINLGLMSYEMVENDLLPPPNNEVYSSEYLLSTNEQMTMVYPFIRFNINFKNFCDQELYQQ